MTATPYADEAFTVLNAGLGSPVPVPYGQKKEPLAGWTGKAAPYAGAPEVGDWLVRYGTFNIAVRVADGVVGIDVDAYKAVAVETLADFEDEWGGLAPTVVSTSREYGASGIRWYRVAAGQQWPSSLGPGVEVIHPGHRYAVWKGSLHPEGGTYRLDDWRTGEVDVQTPEVDDLPYLTERQQRGLQAKVREAKAEAVAYSGAVWDELSDVERDILADEVPLLVEERLQLLREMSTWPEGHVDDLGRGWEKRTADVAQTLRTLLAEGWSGVDPASLYEAYLDAAPGQRGSSADPVEKWRTQAGKPAVDGGRIANPVAGFLPFPDWMTAESPTEKADAAVALGLDWSTFFEVDDNEPEWIVGELLERGQQMALVGDGKVGKSVFCLDWAVSIAAGLPFLSKAALEPLKVLYVDQENTGQDIRRRLRALGDHGRTDPEELSNLTYVTFRHGQLDTQPGADRLLADVEVSGAQVVFLDTVSRLIAGKENDADTWLQFYALTLQRLKAAGVAVIRLDHLGKDTDRGARGSSAKTQDIDHVYELRGSGSSLKLKRTHSRTGLGDELIQINRTGTPGEIGGTRHERSLHLNVASKYHDDETVRAMVRLLEDLGTCPPVFGYRGLKDWAAEHGIKLTMSTDKWRAVAEQFNAQTWAAVNRRRG